jgi:NodT family efflux transporter outer membrane factor (OMF) lipoprotein
LPEYVHNGFKVGPNFVTPSAPVAKEWIDAGDKRVRSEADDLSKWWTVFEDPILDQLVCSAYRQNLTLREAGYRIMQARATYGFAVGNVFPQTQDMTGSYQRIGLSSETVNGPLTRTRFFDQWSVGFNLAWELDFWGRFRRDVESARANLDASVFDYDDVLVTLLSDVATNYVLMRTAELRIKYARENVDIQRKTLNIAEAKFKGGAVRELDVDQAQTLLFQTEATIPELEINLRVATNRLCVLLGIPTEDLRQRLGAGPIPLAPPEVAVGIPADLLRRRPDVRRAERQAAAQSALIGVAESDFYPHISLIGTLGYSAASFSHVFRSSAFNGNVGPTFQWNLLNYGRILNNVRFQDAKFQELFTTYQNKVLTAQEETENGLVTFLKAQQRAKLQGDSVKYAEKAVKIVMTQYDGGIVDFTRVTQLQQILVQEQDLLAQSQGEIALGLIQVYKALGGGWQIRKCDCEPMPGLDELQASPAPAYVPPPHLGIALPEPD